MLKLFGKSHSKEVSKLASKLTLKWALKLVIAMRQHHYCSVFSSFAAFPLSGLSSGAKVLAVGLLATSLSGCFTTGAEHRPIVDGGDLANYESDLVECQQLALQRDPNDEETKTSALIGAVIGTLVGLGEGAEEAVAGAAVGALIGGGEQAYDTDKDRKHIVINCMRGRGYNVVESTR